MRVFRTAKPGEIGTKQLTEKYGELLVCVRYRLDEKRKKRLKTVELIIEEKEWMPHRETHGDERPQILEPPNRSAPIPAKESNSPPAEGSAPIPAEESNFPQEEGFFWFCFRGYFPVLFQELKEAGIRRGKKQGVWGLPWSTALGFGLLEKNKQIQQVQGP